jgi:hypothetical protein
MYDASVSSSAFTLGEFNNDPASADYGSILWVNNTGDYSFTYPTGTSGTSTHISSGNALIYDAPAASENLRFTAGVISSATDSGILYDPKASSSPIRTNVATAGTLTTRNRTRVNTEAVKIRIGFSDDSGSPSAVNGAVAFIMVYSRALTTAEVIAQYDVTKAQLQALFPDNTRYADL